MSQLRLREQLHHLRMPVLVVDGDLETIVGVENILADYLNLPAPQRCLLSTKGRPFAEPRGPREPCRTSRSLRKPSCHNGRQV